MAEESKDTIYVDVDDEITTVIDKVNSSPKKLVALVLPKRASVFQSIVNMKLLKRKSDEAKKNIVLVTGESSILPLAGAVGLHVAKTLASKPEIPAAPIVAHDMLEAAEDEAIPMAAAEEAAMPEEAQELKKEALDEINKSAAKAKPAAASDAKDLDTIELDNTADADKPTDTAMPAIAASEAKKKAKKNKKLKVPNFNKFRIWAVLGGGVLIILIILWILLFKVFPHATIDVKTNAQNVNANLTFNLDTLSSSFSKSGDNVPAKQVTETKTYTATVNATGQQNNGQTASGNITMTAQECAPNLGQPNPVPAGTGVSANNETYITQQATTFSSFGTGHGSCQTYPSSGSTTITAQNPGSAYNTSSSNFSVPGRSDVSATGSASGGTDDNVTIVSQADINNAENKVSTNSSGAQSDLSSQLTNSNYYPIGATFNAGSPTISANATAGTAASSVTVTETVKYTMYGVVKSDLNQLLNNNINSQTGSNQTILNNGLSTASYSVGTSPTSVSLAATAVVGPNINVTALKKEITGQKVATIESTIKSDPNVSSVSVKLSPFYVSKAPSASKITINIAKPTNNPSNANSN